MWSQQAACTSEGRLSTLLAQPATIEQDSLARRNRIPPQVLTPATRHRIGLNRAVRNVVRFEQDREPRDVPISIASHAERLRCPLPPRKHLRSSRSRLVTVHDRAHCKSVLGTR